MATLSREARVLKYFSQRARGESLGVTKLLKLAYLSDLFAREWLGRPITSFRYVYHHHGPFDSGLYSAIDELETSRLVRTERSAFLSFRSRRERRGVVDEGAIADLGFTPAEERILDYVAREFGPMPLDELLARVYETAPMKAAERKKPIPMHIADNAGKAELGYDLAEVMEQEREIDQGNYVLAGDFFDALRSQTLADDAYRD